MSKICLESLSNLGQVIALEAETADGITRKEAEYEYYAEITDTDAFSKAVNKIHQEQWRLDLGDSRGTIRVRKNVESGTIKYEQTLKLNIESDGPKSCLENTLQCSVDFYNAFVAMSNHGQIKDRHIFPIEGTDMNWEIDQFYTKAGELYPIVKLDLEVVKALDNIPEFPQGFKIIVQNQKGSRTQEEIDIISKLMSECSHQTQTQV